MPCSKLIPIFLKNIITVISSNDVDRNNGMQIHSYGINLKIPGIQLNYFPNAPAIDSVLVTDSVGNLNQKAI